MNDLEQIRRQREKLEKRREIQKRYESEDVRNSDETFS
jgi:hypothetical protein